MGTRRLTLLRHGQAQPPEAYAEDFERPLTRRGGNEAAEMAKRILIRGDVPDLIVASPAERAWATAVIVARVCELDAKALRCARELYSATPAAIWRLVTGLAPALEHVLICAHNPSLSDLAGRLGPQPQARRLPTAGLARAIWNHAEWRALQPETAVLCELDDPDDLADSFS